MVIHFEKVKLIIFDFDGVLFNGLDAIKMGIKEAIEKYDLKVDFQEAVDDIASLIQKLMPIPIPKIILQSYSLLNQVGFLASEKSFFKKLRIGLSIYREYLDKVAGMNMYEGTTELLDILDAKGIKLAIDTSGTKESVIEKLERAGLKRHFPDDMIVGAGDVSPGRVKPDPQGIEILVERAGLTLEDVKDGAVIFVGDMSTDVEAGKRAFNNTGVGTVGIKSGYDSRIADARPDLLLDRATQLLSHIK